MSTSRSEISHWTQRMLDSDALILDTETTGLHRGEICQIAVIGVDGTVHLDQYVKPVYPIPVDAYRIHGIDNTMVADAEGWSDVAPRLKQLLSNRELVIYNAEYDVKIMHCSAQFAGMERIDWRQLASCHCAMLQYAEFYGDWNNYRNDYRWQKLTDACAQQRIPPPDAPAHSALGDCLRTLSLLKAMAAWQPVEAG